MFSLQIRLQFLNGALADMDARQTIPEITKLLKDENEAVRLAVESALKTMGVTDK